MKTMTKQGICSTCEESKLDLKPVHGGFDEQGDPIPLRICPECEGSFAKDEIEFEEIEESALFA